MKKLLTLPRLLRIFTVAIVTTAAAALSFVQPASAFTPNVGWGYYLHPPTLVNEPSSCLDVVNAGTANNTPVQTWECGPQWNQQWLFSDFHDTNGFPTWKITPRYLTSKCLSVLNDVDVVIRTCDSGWDQRWYLNAYSGNQVYMQPAYTTKVITTGSWGTPASLLPLGWGLSLITINTTP